MSEVDKSRLSALHRALTTAVGELERLGAFEAAAHVASALDAIEATLEVGPVPNPHPDATGGFATIARRMRETFGSEAEAVARRQLGAANGASLMAWAAIVSRIAA